MSVVWRCERCNKVKDLKGPHLDGKTRVRSDCWPCAKKTTFVRESADSSPSSRKDAGNSRAPAPANLFESVFATPAAASASPVKPASAPAAATAGAASVPGVWRCVECKKVKDLKGPHLDGKSSVRSDCWPCAKKTTFVKESAAGIETAAATATTTTAAAAAATTAKTAVNASALPVSLSVTPSNEAQVAAFQNIFAAATAAAAAARTSSTSAGVTTTATSSSNSSNPPTFPFLAVSREETKTNAGNNNSSGGGDGSRTGAAAVTFGTPRTSSNPFVTPAVSAASIKKFQISYANVMATKHEDPTTNTTAADGSKRAASAGTTTTTPSTTGSVFTPPTTSPYVMESSAGTSPPFTFRPNANYIPTSSAAGSGGAGVWSTAALLPGSTAAVSPSSSPAEAAFAASTSPAVDGTGSSVDTSTTGSVPLVWMCEHCHKVKDLKGDHLRGKTTVRSDCWPCAKKRTFVLTSPSALAASSWSLKLGSSGSGANGAGAASGSRSSASVQPRTTTAAGDATAGVPSRAASNAAPAQSAATVGAAAPPMFSNPFAAPPMLVTPPRTAINTTATATAVGTAEAESRLFGGGAAPSSKPLSWVAPAIPPTATAEEAFLFHPDALRVVPAAAPPSDLEAKSTHNRSSHNDEHNNSSAPPAASTHTSWIAAATAAADDGPGDAATYYAAMARFDQQLLQSFRERLVGGVQLRAVWHDRVLYVIAADTATDPGDLVGAFAELGRYAALYLAVEQKLSASRFRHVGRLFCPNEFAFAAACCYANNFFGSESSSSSSVSLSSSKFKVYGPQTDPTKSLSLWGRIVAASPVAQRCVVSEAQRVVAAQTLYRRVSWLAAPQTMTATAIQLSVEAESTEDAHGVDVVLLTGTMKLEELPQAVPLAQLSQPYA